MSRFAHGFALLMLTPMQVLAQSGPGAIVLSGTAAGGQTCVQVQVNGEKPSVYDCLNQQLQREVQGSGAASAEVPLSATSQSNQVGTFNEAGVAEEYGQNFGKSAIPYRPVAPVFSNALGPVR